MILVGFVVVIGVIYSVMAGRIDLIVAFIGLLDVLFDITDKQRRKK
jgi:hypothetical protein